MQKRRNSSALAMELRLFALSDWEDTPNRWREMQDVNGLMQKRRNFCVLAMELHLFGIKPSM